MAHAKAIQVLKKNEKLKKKKIDNSNIFEKILRVGERLSLTNCLDQKGTKIELQILRILADHKQTSTYLVR